jgi:death-on-curing protein
MTAPVWVLRATVLSLHEQLLAQFGGPAGIRDEGLLASAPARPQNLFTYEKPTAFDLASSYAFGLIKDHAFVDGNKRTGFAVAALFLELNGYRFEAAEADATVQTLALAASAISQSDYARWLETNSRKV